MNPVTSCPICFENLSDKIKASPDNCEHIFCLPCLEKWSKLGSYCPVDRKRFKKILNLSTDTLIQVKSHKRKRRRIVYDFTAHCEICSSTTDSNVMLLCDCCDLGYHIHCLKPPLKEIPAGLWFCPTCISVEEKLKKKNGITKEVEAELGGFNDTLLYKTKCREKVNEKKSMVKAKEFDNSMPVKNANFQTCYDIISNFEDMIVRKKHCEDAGSSSYLDNTINKIDKIYKSFDIASKNSRVEHSKHLKTYSIRKACKKAKIIKSFDVEQGKKSYPESNSINTDDTCLSQNSMSSDINLQNHTLSVSHEFLDVDTLYDDVDDDHSLNRKDIEQVNSNIDDNIQVEMYSETSGILSDEFLENSPQRKNQIVNSSVVQVFEDTNSFGSESMTVFDKNVKKTAPGKSHEKMHAIDKVLELTAERDSFKNMPVLERNVKLNAIRKSFEKMPLLEKNLRKETEKSLTIKQKTFNRTVIASNAEVSLPSGSCVRKMSSKEKCASSRESNFDSAKFQPRVVLSRINLNDNNLNCVSNSSCTLTSSESCSYYNFQASASDKLIKTNGYYTSKKVSNPSNKCLSVSTHGRRKVSSSDNESENSEFSDHTEIYNTSFQHSSTVHNESLLSSDIGNSTSFNESKNNPVDINNEKIFSSDEESESNPASFSENVKNFTGNQNENSFSSDEEEESDCNNYESSFNENIESSVGVQKETSTNPGEPLSRNALKHLAIRSDGSFYLNCSLSENCASETRNKPSSSYVKENNNKEVTQIHFNCNEVGETSENSLLNTKTRTSELHSLSENDERFMESVESAYDDAYVNDSESSSDDERLDLNPELLPKNVKSAPLSLNDLRYLAINPDGTFSISKPTLKANEADSQSRNFTMEPLSEHNQCTVNCDSPLCNQSVNLDILNENKNFTDEEEILSARDSASGNITQFSNESTISSTHFSQSEQSQFNNTSVTSDHVNENETHTHEPESFSDDERLDLDAEPLTEIAKPAPLSLNDLRYLAINPDGTFSISKSTLKANEADSQSRNFAMEALSEHSPLSNQSVNLDILNENENFTDEEEIFSARDSASGNITQFSNESTISSTHFSQSERSQFNNTSVTSEHVNENETHTHEPDSFPDENETFAYEAEPFSERDSVSGNHISPLTNESSVSSTHPSQNEQSQFNKKSVISDPVIKNETHTYEPEPFSDDEIEIVAINHKSVSNFRFPSQNEQCTSYQLTSESMSSVNADHVQQPDNSNTKKKMIHWKDSQYIIPKVDGLYFFEQ